MRQAIGFFEIRSKAAAIEAADTMLKTADVRIKDFNLVGSGVISVVIEGDVAAVRAAIENAKATAGHMAEIISINVIPRPNKEVDKLFD